MASKLLTFLVAIKNAYTSNIFVMRTGMSVKPTLATSRGLYNVDASRPVHRLAYVLNEIIFYVIGRNHATSTKNPLKPIRAKADLIWIP
jgi:hypothetical protein